MGVSEVAADGESEAMLSHVVDATTVRGRIEDPDPGRTFDAVVLAGNLINTADLEQRAAFLGAVRRHPAADRWLTSRWVVARRCAWNPRGGDGVRRVSG